MQNGINHISLNENRNYYMIALYDNESAIIFNFDLILAPTMSEACFFFKVKNNVDTSVWKIIVICKISYIAEDIEIDSSLFLRSILELIVPDGRIFYTKLYKIGMYLELIKETNPKNLFSFLFKHRVIFHLDDCFLIEEPNEISEKDGFLAITSYIQILSDQTICEESYINNTAIEKLLLEIIQ